MFMIYLNLISIDLFKELYLLFIRHFFILGVFSSIPVPQIVGRFQMAHFGWYIVMKYSWLVRWTK